MSYRRYQRYSKPTPRNITVKYAGHCSVCGGVIPVGAIATYYPAGTVAGVHTGTIAHIGGLDGNSRACYAEFKKQPLPDAPKMPQIDRFDAQYEDDCARACGLDGGAE